MEGCGNFYYLRKVVNDTALYGIEHLFISYAGGDNVPSDVPFASMKEICLERYMNENAPDIVHFHDVFSKYIIEKTNDHETFYKLSKNMPCIRTIHDYSSIVCPLYFNEGHEKGECRAVLNPSCIDRCIKDTTLYEDYMDYIKALESYAGISCFSEDTRKRAEMHNLPASKIYKLPPLIKPPDEYGRAKENIILFAGRMVRQKGLEYLFNALNRLKTKDWVLYVAGEHDALYYRYLYKMAFQYGFHNRVNFVGLLPQQRLFELYRTAKVLAFPSIGHETFGMSGAEASAFGVPVAAFRVDGVSEWLEDGVNGRIVEFNNIDMYADALDEIVGNEEAYSRFREGAIAKSRSIDYNGDIKRLAEYYYSFAN